VDGRAKEIIVMARVIKKTSENMLGDFKYQIAERFHSELDYIEQSAGELPNAKNKDKYLDVGALWVISGAGSYFKKLTSSSSDKIYKKHPWYPGQDRDRLEYAKKWLDAYRKVYPGLNPALIYNGTKEQNTDLAEAISSGKFRLKGPLFISPGKIVRTLDQIKQFSFNPEFKKGQKLAVLSHSAHIPRILRFMDKFKQRFKSVEVIAVSISLEPKDEREMAKIEKRTLLGYIKRDEASQNIYPKSDLLSITHVTEEDMLEIFRLSNQKSIRAVSFNPKKIRLAEHKTWFRKKIRDKNTLMLKALIGGSLAGQVRLDITGQKALIGISTSEEFRGRGVARRLIASAKEQARASGIKQIDAYIKPDNIASIALFTKSGFKFVTKTDQSGSPANKYVYLIR
jgi:RimJ/RimL family protein N-acetyltransferase